MKISLRNFNGFFQVDYHTRFVRLLWMLSIPISLSIITFGIWAIVAEFFNSSQSIESQFNGKVLVILFMLVFPVLVIIIGTAKILRKPGVYLCGIRVSNTGIEIGTLTLDVNSGMFRDICENRNADNLIEGNWKQKRTIRNKAVNFVIALRTGCDPLSGIFFERFVVTSGNEHVYQMIGNNSPENRCKDLVAVSNGSFQLLANYNGIPPDQLLKLLGIAADIISTWGPSPLPSCTLRIAPGLANGGSVLAYGVLGGVNTAGVSSPGDKEPLENIFDKNFTKSLRNFLKERGWIFAE